MLFLKNNSYKMILLTPDKWSDYELIDTGNGEKLERFGNYILRRPEPQAVWQKSLTEKEWETQANAYFKREKNSQNESEKGDWVLKPGMPGQWFVNYSSNGLKLRMRLGLTAFKHIGIFPEQAENWDYIYQSVKDLKVESPRVLNLFAYTGGASLAAKAAGADVVHVDSVKQVINWAAENQQASNLDGIRWVVEDAMKYIKREVKRGKTYHGIILDPPAYGRGPDGEKWILEDSINELIQLCSQILEKENNFFVLNLYSMGFSALIAENLIKTHFPNVTNHQLGEIYLKEQSGKRLPLGVFLRFKQ
jgi:23S rRNA (cytosine1962-C5)-methyltransferase